MSDQTSTAINDIPEATVIEWSDKCARCGLPTEPYNVEDMQVCGACIRIMELERQNDRYVEALRGIAADDEWVGREPWWRHLARQALSGEDIAIPLYRRDDSGLRDVFGDLIDALGDELKQEISRTSHVQHHMRAAVQALGHENYRDYLSAWWLGGAE